MQCGLQRDNHHLRPGHLPVDTTQFVDDAVDSTEDRRGQLSKL